MAAPGGRATLPDEPARYEGVCQPRANGVKLRRDWQQPEVDLGERGQPAGLPGLSGLVPAAWPFGLAGVAAARALRHEVAVEGDLEGQVGEGLAELVRGKRSRDR